MPEDDGGDRTIDCTQDQPVNSITEDYRSLRIRPAHHPLYVDQARVLGADVPNVELLRKIAIRLEVTGDLCHDNQFFALTCGPRTDRLQNFG
ncbi:hypothetical protein ASE68_05415 [Agromyces sp. Leaf222]|nr:hypothetical protein ASE68_05415 [Agromyces sp. Leaf222]